jgi:hypothetical protein
MIVNPNFLFNRRLRFNCGFRAATTRERYHDSRFPQYFRRSLAVAAQFRVIP